MMRAITMRNLGLLLLILAALRMTPATAQTAPADDISTLIARLSSPDYAQREAAQARLEALPSDQFWPLKKQADAQLDLETKSRLMAVLWFDAANIVRHRSQLPPSSRMLTGRILAAAGKPLSHVAIQITCQDLPVRAGFAIVQSLVTDGAGRFAAPVPFPKLRYHMRIDTSKLASAAGVQSSYLESDFPTPSPAIPPDFVLKTISPVTRRIHGKVLDPEGKPAAHTPVRLLDDQLFEEHATTTATGEFSADWDADDESLLPLVHSGELCSPLAYRHAADPIIITLVRHAALSGKVRSGAVPVANVSVELRFPNEKSFRKTTSDAAGEYHFDDLPPGDYALVAHEAAWLLAPSRQADFPSIRLLPGQSMTADILMQKTAFLMGQVLDPAGRPESSAIVGAWAVHRSSFDSRWSYVLTDAEGHFLLPVQPGDPDLSLVAFSPASGMLEIRTGLLQAGEMRSLTVALPGIIEVHGTLLDAAGHPIPNVTCAIHQATAYSALSKPDGSFDLGPVYLMPNQTPSVAFVPPRPCRSDGDFEQIVKMGNMEVQAFDSLATRGWNGYHFYVPLSEVAGTTRPSPSFYLPAELPLPATHGAHADLHLVLASAHLIQITGMLLDPTGKPAPSAEIYLLPGTTDPRNWMRDARWNKVNAGKIADVTPRDPRLAETRTNADGRFCIFLVPEDLYARGVSVGAYLNNAQAIVSNVKLSLNASPKPLTLHLAPSPPPAAAD